MVELFDNIQSFINEAKSTNSINEKIKIIKQYPQLQEFFKFVYDPDLKYHVTPASLKKRKAIVKKKHLDPNVDGYQSLLDLLKYLTNAPASNKTRDTVLQFIESNENYKSLLWLIFDKSKKLGVSIGLKTMLKVFPSLCKQWSVALGSPFKSAFKKYFDKSIANAETWFISRKYDGIRCIVICTNLKSNPTVKTFSRYGKEFKTLDLLKEYIIDYVLRAQHLMDNYKSFVFDGEIIVEDDDGNEDFKTAVGDIKRKDTQMSNFIYKVFDMLTMIEFTSGTSKFTFSERTSGLRNLLKCVSTLEPPNELIQFVKQTEYNEISLDRLKTQFVNEGWEGLILRKDSGYSGKRSNDILKIKRGGTTEEVVESISVGTKDMLIDGKMIEQDILAAVNVMYKGVSVSVGSGFNDADRIKYFKRPEDIIGTIIRINYMDITKAGSLRHPIFTGIISEPNKERDI